MYSSIIGDQVLTTSRCDSGQELHHVYTCDDDLDSLTTEQLCAIDPDDLLTSCLDATTCKTVTARCSQAELGLITGGGDTRGDNESRSTHPRDSDSEAAAESRNRQHQPTTASGGVRSCRKKLAFNNKGEVATECETLTSTPIRGGSGVSELNRPSRLGSYSPISSITSSPEKPRSHSYTRGDYRELYVQHTTLGESGSSNEETFKINTMVEKMEAMNETFRALRESRWRVEAIVGRGVERGDRDGGRGDGGVERGDRGGGRRDKGDGRGDRGGGRRDKGDGRGDRGVGRGDRGDRSGGTVGRDDRGDETGDRGYGTGDTGGERGDRGDERGDRGAMKGEWRREVVRGDRGDTDDTSKGSDEKMSAKPQSQQHVSKHQHFEKLKNVCAVKYEALGSIDSEIQREKACNMEASQTSMNNLSSTSARTCLISSKWPRNMYPPQHSLSTSRLDEYKYEQTNHVANKTSTKVDFTASRVRSPLTTHSCHGVNTPRKSILRSKNTFQRTDCGYDRKDGGNGRKDGGNGRIEGGYRWKEGGFERVEGGCGVDDGYGELMDELEVCADNMLGLVKTQSRLLSSMTWCPRYHHRYPPLVHTTHPPPHTTHPPPHTIHPPPHTTHPPPHTIHPPPHTTHPPPHTTHPPSHTTHPPPHTTHPPPHTTLPPPHITHPPPHPSHPSTERHKTYSGMPYTSDIDRMLKLRKLLTKVKIVATEMNAFNKTF